MKSNLTPLCRHLGLLACVVGLSPPAHAGVIELAKYTFPTTTSLGSADTDASSTASNFSRVGTSSGPAVTNSANATPGGTGGAAWLLSPTPTSESAALLSGHSFRFSVTPVAGYELDLDTLSLSAAGNANSSGGAYAVYYSLDNTNFEPLLGATNFAPRAGGVTFDTRTIDLSGAAFQNLNKAITFRLYAWDANPTNNKGYFDNVILTGASVEISAANAVPEPAGLALLAVGLAGLGTRRRRHTHRA